MCFMSGNEDRWIDQRAEEGGTWEIDAWGRWAGGFFFLNYQNGWAFPDENK